MVVKEMDTLAATMEGLLERSREEVRGGGEGGADESRRE